MNLGIMEEDKKQETEENGKDEEEVYSKEEEAEIKKRLRDLGYM